MPFEFATAGRVRFGAGTLREVPEALNAWGRRFLVVGGRSPGRVDRFAQSLAAVGLEPHLFRIGGEPSVEEVERGRAAAEAHQVEGVVAFGGGSAIDAGKAIAALATNPGDPLQYLEGVGQGRPLVHAPLPFVAIPTTAGTGSEATRNAVLLSTRHRVKVSLRSPGMLPRLALVDPELSWHLPPEVTAATGLDALTQLIEPFLSCRANPVVDALCREGLRRVSRSLPVAYAAASRCVGGPGASAQDLTEAERVAREDMALAALLSGMALANAGLGAVHGFAGPIGGMFPAPHGAVCAALLVPVLAVNLEALRRRAPDSPTLGRFDEVAQLLTGRSSAVAADGIAWVGALCRRLQTAGLSRHGVGRAQLPELVEKAASASSMKGNPIPLTAAELADILTRAL